jgi:hypothetical protein
MLARLPGLRKPNCRKITVSLLKTNKFLSERALKKKVANKVYEDFS